jgi:hypothetical protein
MDRRYLDLGTNFTSRPLYLRGKSPRCPLDRRLGGPQSRSGRCEAENGELASVSNEVSPYEGICRIEGKVLNIFKFDTRRSQLLSFTSCFG